jgi:PBP1b-binding outer membrane lipoprotein LpoB
MSRFVSAGIAALLLAGCSHAAPERLDPQQEYPDTGRPETSGAGQLTVYTEPYPDTPAGRLYSGYTLYDAQGVRIGYIRNHTPTDSADVTPTTVTLSAGRYLIRTDLPPERPRIFWVTIDRGKETRLDAVTLTETPAGEPGAAP